MSISGDPTLRTPPPQNLAAQVLIVEDEPDHADVMSDALRRPGHVCTVVNSVEAAFEELRLGAFDIIVTDLRMPGSGGFIAQSLPPVAPDGADAGLRVVELA